MGRKCGMDGNAGRTETRDGRKRGMDGNVGWTETWDGWKRGMDGNAGWMETRDGWKDGASVCHRPSFPRRRESIRGKDVVWHKQASLDSRFHGNDERMGWTETRDGRKRGMDGNAGRTETRDGRKDGAPVCHRPSFPRKRESIGKSVPPMNFLHCPRRNQRPLKQHLDCVKS